MIKLSIYAVRFSANSIIPKRKKGYYKFWWTTELNELKAKAMASCTVWKNAGKPRYRSIFQTYKLLYKLRRPIKTEQSGETEYYTNNLHDALMKQELSYRQQIARQLRTQYAEGIYA